MNRRIIILILLFLFFQNASSYTEMDFNPFSSDIIVPLYAPANPDEMLNKNSSITAALLDKQLIKLYGKDKYYKLLSERFKECTRVIINIRSWQGHFYQAVIPSSTENLDIICNITEDNKFIEHLVNQLYKIPHLIPYFKYEVEPREYYSFTYIIPSVYGSELFQRMDKDRYMDWYAAQLDSILAQPIEYKFEWNDTTQVLPKRRVPQNLIEYEQMRRTQ